MKGFAYDPDSMFVSAEDSKFLRNIIDMPVNSVILLSGIALVVYGIIKSLFLKYENSIWYSGTGTVMTVFALFILAGFNNTCFYPSLSNPQSSLNIANASSSHYTLTAMSYVSILVPFVFGYIFYAWRSINNKKIDQREIESESHSY